MSSNYNLRKLRRAVVHFVGGRVVQATGRAVLLLLIVRLLAPAEYGVYMVLIGLSEALLQMCNFGLLRVGQRFLPEVADSARLGDTYRFVATIGLLQLALLAIAVSLLWRWWAEVLAFAGFSAEHIAQSEPGLWLFLLVPIFRFMIELLDALLDQARSQICRALMPWGRIAAVSTVLVQGNEISLPLLLILDVGVTAFCTLLAFVLLTSSLRRLQGSTDPKPLPVQGMLRHAWHLSVMDLLSSTYSPGTVRFVIGNTLGIVESGLFAFLQSLQKLIGRYLPGILLLGLVRPMLISRAQAANGMMLLNKTASLLYKSNWLIIAGAAVVALLIGDWLIALASGGKFLSAGDTLLVMILVLAVTSHRRVLEMLLQIVNQTQILRVTALFAPLTIAIIWVVAPSGLNPAMLAAAASFAVGNWIASRHLQRTTNQFLWDWRGVLGIAAPTLVSAAAGYAVQLQFGMWFGLATAGLLAVLLLAVLKPFLHEEMTLADRGVGALARRALAPFTKQPSGEPVS